MNRFVLSESRLSILFTLSILLFIAIAAVMPSRFVSHAIGKDRKGLIQRTSARDPKLPNYDIRSDKQSVQKVASLRQKAGIAAAAAVADVRERLVRGEENLRSLVPSLSIEYNTGLKIPEVIAADVKQGPAFLTNPTSGKRSNVLLNFLKQHNSLFGLSYEQVDRLKVFSDYTNPNGKLSFVELNQEINGIPVFGGEVKAGFTKNGKIVRIINNLAPGLEYSSLSSEFGDPTEAIRSAYGYINRDPNNFQANRNESLSTDLKAVYGEGNLSTTAEKIYFPTEPSVAVPAWRVLIWQPVNAFYLVVDASTGTLLWRKNITNDQTQSATYNVWANPNAMINVAESPFPLTPGPSSPNGVQGAGIPRTLITRIGNEPPYEFNNNGWINDNDNFSRGNAVAAGLDREDPNGIDPAGSTLGSPNRVFDFPINPGIPTNPAQNGGDSPLPAGSTPTPCLSTGMAPGLTDFQKASVTQLFYIANRYHDETYLLGFTEAARNFQLNNFGRGGLGSDHVMAEGQDCIGTNNANFATPADGSSGRMQMFIFTGPTLDFDGDLDAEVVVHELTHGLSNRLHGNADGLSTSHSDGMGEGWSDFYAQAMLSEPTDPINGIYAVGGYDTYQFGGIGFNNYYYGIRRFPTAIMAATGGTNNLPHNPLTFADIDSTKINLSDGAFAPAFTGSADEVHNAGEVWNTALWEVRAKFIQRLGWATGNRRWLQLVTDGMKLAPLSPAFISERDAIISAAIASGTAADVADIWAGFAIRGIGFSASIQALGGNASGFTRVTESFDMPNLLQSPDFTVNDAAGNNNGFPEPGEQVSLSIPLTNITGQTATGVTLQIVGGGSANYGTINHTATSSQQVNFTVPIGSACGSALSIMFEVNSNLGPTTITRTIALGLPFTTFTENFDGTAAPNFPLGWNVTSDFEPMAFVTTTTGPDTAPNSAFAADPDAVGGSTTLTSPFIFVNTDATATTVTFRHKFNTERDWDGGVLEISIGGSLAPFDDIVTAGGTFLQNGYNGSMGVSDPNPLGGRNGWTGDSGGYMTTIVRLPAAAAGQNVRLRWLFGADNNTAPLGGGWNVDTISVQGLFICTVTLPPKNVRADFDGDGKTDVSVFRPSDGNWYVNRSTSGFTAVNWGLSTDRPVPADYDGDGATDFAVYRQNNGNDPTYFILSSKGFLFTPGWWGLGSDIPVTGDYDGDGKADLAVFRPSEGIWYIRKSGGGMDFINWGLPTDKPVQGDYDGDGKTDIAIYRSGQWWIKKSTGAQSVFNWGLGTDKPVTADYDGDGKDDMAVYRPSDGIWYIVRSSNGAFDFVQFGISTDIPVPGDYDGDGKSDQAVYRGGVWFENRSTSGLFVDTFGVANDRPLPSTYIP